jgi:hypothetical protein
LTNGLLRKQFILANQKVYIDDAGDPGFRIGRGSSEYFVIACVIIDKNSVMEDISLELNKFREELGWGKDTEFKFNKTNKKYVKELLQRIASYNFRIRAICVDKNAIRSNEFKTKQHSFYNYMIKEVLSKITYLDNAKIYLDGHADRPYRKAAKTYFRTHLNADGKKVSDIKFVDSKSDDLIQVADLCAGSILRSCRKEKSDCMEYRNILLPRIEDVWDFG